MNEYEYYAQRVFGHMASASPSPIIKSLDENSKVVPGLKNDRNTQQLNNVKGLHCKLLFFLTISAF